MNDIKTGLWNSQTKKGRVSKMAKVMMNVKGLQKQNNIKQTSWFTHADFAHLTARNFSVEPEGYLYLGLATDINITNLEDYSVG